jgi:uncharacterized membrane protein
MMKENTMFAAHLWHPRVVHFAVGLVIAAVICEVVYVMTKRELFRDLARWNLLFGTLGTVATFVTGLIAEEFVQISRAAHEAFELHETLGYVTLILVLLALAFRLVKEGDLYRRYSAVFLVILLAAAFSLSIGAHFGGKLVFDHGVGVAPSVVLSPTYEETAGGR